jgi:hypothetical protein
LLELELGTHNKIAVRCGPITVPKGFPPEIDLIRVLEIVLDNLTTGEGLSVRFTGPGVLELDASVARAARPVLVLTAITLRYLQTSAV